MARMMSFNEQHRSYWRVTPPRSEGSSGRGAEMLPLRYAQGFGSFAQHDSADFGGEILSSSTSQPHRLYVSGPGDAISSRPAPPQGWGKPSPYNIRRRGANFDHPYLDAYWAPLAAFLYLDVSRSGV